MGKLQELPVCSIFTTGRTGSDLLQSLLDSHPEVLNFNGHLMFQSFWRNSVCVGAGSYAPRDLIHEFIGKNIELLRSRYDLLERKHQLGESGDQSLDIDLERFTDDAVQLLETTTPSAKNTLRAIYGAYGMALGQDLGQKRVILHHPHDWSELPATLADFPDSKVICMTRDPRANFVSGIEHHRKSNTWVDTDNGGHLFFYINRILRDARPLEAYGNDYKVIRIEDLGNQDVLSSLCRWLDISYDECLTRSTWGGLSWKGDQLSRVNREPGFSSEMLKNDWQSRLGSIDKFVLNYIMGPRLKYYRYGGSRSGVFGLLLAPFLILLPLKYERRFWSPGYILGRLRKGQAKIVGTNGLNYLRRVRAFLKFYAETVSGKKFTQPLLVAEPSSEDVGERSAWVASGTST